MVKDHVEGSGPVRRLFKILMCHPLRSHTPIISPQTMGEVEWRVGCGSITFHPERVARLGTFPMPYKAIRSANPHNRGVSNEVTQVTPRSFSPYVVPPNPEPIHDATMAIDGAPNRTVGGRGGGISWFFLGCAAYC
jgi:hypothetical protein